MTDTQQHPTCCGVLVFRKKKLADAEQKEDNWECAIVLQDNGRNYSFPKGGKHKGETPLQNAKRELEEETSLTDEHIELLPPESTFVDEQRDGKLCVRYFVGILRDEFYNFKLKAKDPTEIDQVDWFSYPKAAAVLIPRRLAVLVAGMAAVSRAKLERKSN